VDSVERKQLDGSSWMEAVRLVGRKWTQLNGRSWIDPVVTRLDRSWMDPVVWTAVGWMQLVAAVDERIRMDAQLAGRS
jgi:hypothetical protein